MNFFLPAALAGVLALASAARADAPLGAYSIRPIPSGALRHRGPPRVRVRESTSSNWSGYAVPLESSKVTDIFIDVQGTWIVPAVTGSKTAAYSSAWVGLDGYNDGTVEQIGTEQDWTGKTESIYVWFEMYPNDAYEIVGFPASVGDSITGQVLYAGEKTVQVSRGRTQTEDVFELTITNNTKRVTFTVPTSYTTIAPAQLGSAEWVLEAPSEAHVLPLADYGSAVFTACKAASVHSSGTLEAISYWPIDPLTMVDPYGGGSMPSALSSGGQSFTTTWLAK